jgi:dienelactone hydrolase
MHFEARSPSFLVVSFLVFSLAHGCGDPPVASVPDAGPSAGSTRLRFAPTEGTMDFGAIPFPDDLYRDDAGVIQIGELPGEAGSIAGAFFDSLRTGLREVDGFGASSAVFFPVEGAVDPSSLPSDPAATVREGASVFLVDVDPASPDAMSRVPADVHWNARTGLLSVRPADGHPLHEGRAYAAVITTSVRGADGLPIAAAEAFATIRDSSAEPTGAMRARAWREYRSVIAGLGASGVQSSAIAGLASFRVQNASGDLTDVRAQLRARPTPDVDILRVASGAALDELLGMPVEALPGRDVEGGVAHAHIGWVVDGRFSSPQFGSPAPFVHGRWERSGDDTFAVRREEDVWFTLVLPAGETASLPLVVFQHGLGNDRSQVFSIADTLTAAGYAVLAIDIPFHGMRARAGSPEMLDSTHAYGETAGPDLYGDIGGNPSYVEYVGVFDEDGSYEAFHPFYPRDSFRQSVADLLAAVDMIERAELTEITAATDGPATLSFDEGPIAFVGVSLGGILGTMFVATETRVGCAVLNVTGGNLTRLVELSAGFNPTFFPILFPKLGLDYSALDYVADPPAHTPQIALYQTLLDAGDSMTFAPALQRRQVHLLFQMAVDDETVPNLGTESLARASGASIAGADARYASLARVELPVRPGFRVGADTFVRTTTTFSPASHGLILGSEGSAAFEHPPWPPFVERASPEPIENPIVAAQEKIVRFFESWRAGTPEVR